MIQRNKDLPITKDELLQLYNPKLMIQFVGTSKSFFTTDDNFIEDTFCLKLTNSKQAIDLYLEEGHILAHTHQTKFKKALKELASQLNAEIK